MKPDLVIRSRRVALPEGTSPASIQIEKGKIVAVGSYEDVPADAPLEDAGNRVVMPGLVDSHVHINEPGRTEWEGFESATRAAAAGGVTTLIDMPLNSLPATTTVDALRAKQKAAKGKCWVDVGFWGGIVPGNEAELRGLDKAGVFGFKCFLVPSGVEEFSCVTEKELRPALAELKRLRALLLVHAEVPGPIEHAAALAADAKPAANKHSTWLASRPREAENEAIALMIGLMVEYSVRVHVVHLASSDALLLLRWSRSDRIPITVETCPHYLTFAADEIPDGATQFKCAPPIREADNRERLWAALGEDLIDMVVSDHSPCPPEMKCGDSGDFLRAWGGISSLQLSLPAVWTEARKRGYTLGHLARWMSRAPARLAGLEERKGAIAVGYDADLVVWDAEATFRVEPAALQHRHKLTPYAGRTLTGVVERTYLSGVKIYDRGEFPAGPSGTLLKRAK